MASVYQMMKGSIVPMTCALSMVLLRKRYFRHQFTGLVMIVSGMIIIGNTAVGHDGGHAPAQFLGIIIILCSQFFHGFVFVIEEWMFKNYQVHPMEMIGWEGVFASFMTMGILGAIQFIPCNDFNICPNHRIDNLAVALNHYKEDFVVLLFSVMLMISEGFYNTLGVFVTQIASSAQRSTIDVSRTIVIWLFFLVYPGKYHEVFLWE